MALDLWFKEDLTRILASHAQHERNTGQGLWLDAYMSAIMDVATALGISAKDMREYGQAQGGFGQVRTIEAKAVPMGTDATSKD